MLHQTCRSLPLGLVLLLLLPLPALAMPAITCHCFTERAYDAAHPAAADPYLLATTQNSFFALAFSIDKKSVVFKKQQGTPADDLWVAYWVASRAGVPPETLLEAKRKNEAWKDVLAPLRLTAKVLGAGFSNALNGNASSARLAEVVVDDLFLRFRLLGEGELRGMRQAGATNQELILAAVIAAKAGQSARSVYLEVKNGSKTWGSLLQMARIDPKNMQKEISGLLSRH